MYNSTENLRGERSRSKSFTLKEFKEKDLLSLLAYETGTHLGDGHLGYNYHKSDQIWKYVFQYTGDVINEYDFYVTTLQPILEKLYGLRTNIAKITRDNTCAIRTQRRDIGTFKESISLPVGKKANVIIPSFINNKNLKINFLRGFADTDFSLSFRIQKKKDYPIISTKLADPILLSQLYMICKSLGLRPHVIFNNKNKREDKFSIVHALFLYGQENLYKWMETVGFWSSKHSTKFVLWENTGKEFPGSTTPERYELLKRLGISKPMRLSSLASGVSPW